MILVGRRESWGVLKKVSGQTIPDEAHPGTHPSPYPARALLMLLRLPHQQSLIIVCFPEGGVHLAVCSSDEGVHLYAKPSLNSSVRISFWLSIVDFLIGGNAENNPLVVPSAELSWQWLEPQPATLSQMAANRPKVFSLQSSSRTRRLGRLIGFEAHRYIIRKFCYVWQSRKEMMLLAHPRVSRVSHT